MDKLEFTKLVKEVVSESAIEGTIQNLNDPPGRKPDAQLVAQSEWFKALIWCVKSSQKQCTNLYLAFFASLMGFALYQEQANQTI